MVTRNVSMQVLILIIIYVIFQAQNFLVITIIAAIVVFIVGAIYGPKDVEEQAKGFVGFDSKYGTDCP
jgi:solute carrier family 12 sodium/potassium/chloride transporter 2